MINKYPYDIETPLDRRAMTIDILAGELERKNRHVSGWRKRVEELKEKIEELSGDLKKVRIQRNTYQAQRNELTNECQNLQQEKYGADQTLLKERNSRKKLNGKAKVIKIMKTQRNIGGKQSEKI